MGKIMSRYRGWSYKRKMFTAEQFKRSWLKASGVIYSEYVKEFKRQYKIPKMRKFLLS